MERAYFYCRGCGTGRYPLDEALGIPAREQLSDGIQQGVCLLGVQIPFERASHAMEVLTGIVVSPREAERITEERGLLLDEQLRVETQQLFANESGPSPSPSPSSGPSSGGVWAATLDAGEGRGAL
jgi:hypothetical protein